MILELGKLLRPAATPKKKDLHRETLVDEEIISKRERTPSKSAVHNKDENLAGIAENILVQMPLALNNVAGQEMDEKQHSPDNNSVRERTPDQEDPPYASGTESSSSDPAPPSYKRKMEE